MLALKCGMKKLICVLVGLLIFPVYIFGGVVCAAGELNITLKSFSDFESLANKLSFIDNVDTININLGSDIDVLWHVTTRPGSKYIFDFTDDKFSGKNINIIGKKSETCKLAVNNRYKITNNLEDTCFLTAKNCSVRLVNVELHSEDFWRKSSYIDLKSPTFGRKTNMSIEGSLLFGLKNNLHGGVVYVNEGAELSIGKSTTFLCCESFVAGGAIFSNGGKVNVLDDERPGVSIKKCKSYCAGGAISSEGNNGVLNLSNIYIEECSSSLGGAIFLSGGKLKMEHSGIVHCTAYHPNKPDSYGGAICAMADEGGFAKINMNNSSINRCTTSGSGGGIYCFGKVSLMADGDATMNRCFAKKNGGAIAVYRGAHVMLKSGKIYECSAEVLGDAVDLCSGGELNIDRSFKIELSMYHGIGTCKHNSRLFDGFDGIYCADDKSTVSIGSIKADLDDDFGKPCFGCTCF